MDVLGLGLPIMLVVAVLLVAIVVGIAATLQWLARKDRGDRL